MKSYDDDDGIDLGSLTIGLILGCLIGIALGAMIATASLGTKREGINIAETYYKCLSQVVKDYPSQQKITETQELMCRYKAGIKP